MKKWNLVTGLAYVIFVLVLVFLMLMVGLGCAVLLDALMGFM